MSDANKRTSLRTRTFLQGKVVFNNRMSSVDCVVRNTSGTGAKLQVTEAVTLPETFELHIPQKGETLRVRLRWRRGDEVGVSYADASAELSTATDLAGRLLELERENARLRELLAEMKAVAGGAEPLKQASNG